jgi:hypothetical protein
MQIVRIYCDHSRRPYRQRSMGRVIALELFKLSLSLF